MKGIIKFKDIFYYVLFLFLLGAYFLNSIQEIENKIEDDHNLYNIQDSELEEDLTVIDIPSHENYNDNDQKASTINSNDKPLSDFDSSISDNDYDIAEHNDIAEDNLDQNFSDTLHNLEAFLNNGSIKILEPERNLTDEEIKLLKDLSRLTDLNEQSTTQYPLDETESDTSSVYETLVREICDGNNVTIISPSPTKSEFSDFGLTPIETENDTEYSLPHHRNLEDGDQYKTHVDYDVESDKTKTKTKTKTLVDYSAPPPTPTPTPQEKEKEKEKEEHADLNLKKKSFVLIARPLKQGEAPLPLPSWTDHGNPPSKFDEPEKRAIWEKDLLIKKFWLKKLSNLGDSWQDISLNNDIHEISTSKAKPEKISVNLKNEDDSHDSDDSDDYDVEESFGLDLLFNEQYHNKLEKQKSNLLETDEDLCLDKLFKKGTVPVHANHSNRGDIENKNESDIKPNELDLSKSKQSIYKLNPQQSI